MIGGAQWCLDTAVDYAKTRIQFGRPIGSFQAVKHKCANMLMELEMARSAAYYAAWAASESQDELPVVASMAKAYASDRERSMAKPFAPENRSDVVGRPTSWGSEGLFGRPALSAPPTH